MTADPSTTEPTTQPDAGDDPITETPGDGEASDAPVDNPSGSIAGPADEHPEDNQHPALDPDLASPHATA